MIGNAGVISRKGAETLSEKLNMQGRFVDCINAERCEASYPLYKSDVVSL